MARMALGLIFAVIIGIALELLGSGGVQAQLTGLGQTIKAPGADLVIEILPAEADFTSEIRLVLPFEQYIATSKNVGTVVHLPPVKAGDELVFEIFVQETDQTFYTGPGAGPEWQNPDGMAHAVVAAIGGPGMWNVGFEDLDGGEGRGLQ